MRTCLLLLLLLGADYHSISQQVSQQVHCSAWPHGGGT